MALVGTQVKALDFKRNYGLVKGAAICSRCNVPVPGPTSLQHGFLRDGLSCFYRIFARQSTLKDVRRASQRALHHAGLSLQGCPEELGPER